MNVLFVTSLLGKEYGGAEVSTGLLREKLLSQGIEVPALTTRKIKNEQPLISISYAVEIPKKLLTLGNGAVDYFLSKKIKKQIEKIKPDLIHIQDTYILPATVAANKTLKVPTVATIRNSVLDKTWELMFPAPISTMLKRRNKTIIKALQEVNCVISVSDYIKNELIERGINREKIVTIYNLPPTFEDSEIAPINQTDGRVHLFAPGFLASFKGFSVLIEAMKHVVESNPNIELIIAGDGPEKKKLEKQTAKLQLERQVKFLGKVRFAHLSKLYAACDIVIFPSIYAEPFGRVALEAMYFGKPVIASRVGGIPEVVIDGETGLLVPPNDPEALAKAIISLVQHPEKCIVFGQKGRFYVQNKFTDMDIASKHLAVYQKTKSETTQSGIKFE